MMMVAIELGGKCERNPKEKGENERHGIPVPLLKCANEAICLSIYASHCLFLMTLKVDLYSK